MKPTLSLIAAALLASLALPAPALADDYGWTGFYLGGHLGKSDPKDGNDGRILFDTNLDGRFGDPVRTAAGADAFSTGFCGGAAITPLPGDGCEGDDGGGDFGFRAGYDWQAGHWVFGVVGEYSRSDATDSVSAFSTTPAFYYFTRDLESTLALRGRVGLAFGDDRNWLAYLTGGVVRAKIDNEFETSNTRNSFLLAGSGGLTGSDDVNGTQVGIGIERKFLDNLSIGLEYLDTRLDDDETRVRVGPGTAPANNPFLLTNPAGTDFRRSDDDFRIASVRVVATWRF